MTETEERTTQWAALMTVQFVMDEEGGVHLVGLRYALETGATHWVQVPCDVPGLIHAWHDLTESVRVELKRGEVGLPYWGLQPGEGRHVQEMIRLRLERGY